jgi:hypothetical protein
LAQISEGSRCIGGPFVVGGHKNLFSGSLSLFAGCDCTVKGTQYTSHGPPHLRTGFGSRLVSLGVHASKITDTLAKKVSRK